MYMSYTKYILSKGEVIKYHIFISVVVIGLSVRCLNTGPEERLGTLYTEHTNSALFPKPYANESNPENVPAPLAFEAIPMQLP